MLHKREVSQSKIKFGKPNGFMENIRNLSFMEALNQVNLIVSKNIHIFNGGKGLLHDFREKPEELDFDFQETGNYESLKEIFIRIPADVNYLIIPRLVISGIGSNLSLSFDTIEDLKISLTEACNNVVKHAYQHNTKKSENNISIYFLIKKRLITIIVKDTGKGFDPKILKANNYPIGRGHGLGLFLIESLMDEVELNSTGTYGTEIKMVKCLVN